MLLAGTGDHRMLLVPVSSAGDGYACRPREAAPKTGSRGLPEVRRLMIGVVSNVAREYKSARRASQLSDLYCSTLAEGAASVMRRCRSADCSTSATHCCLSPINRQLRFTYRLGAIRTAIYDETTRVINYSVAWAAPRLSGFVIRFTAVSWCRCIID